MPKKGAKEPMPRPGDDFYGITRRERGANSYWEIRLAYFDGIPAFVCQVFDFWNGSDCEKSLYRALVVRDENMNLLDCDELRNQSPVNRIYRDKDHPAWYVTYEDNNDEQKGRYFRDKVHGGPEKAFEAAVQFRRGKEAYRYGEIVTDYDEAMAAYGEYGV